MKLAENALLVVGIIAVQAWCAGCIFTALRGVQLLSLERDTYAGRCLAALAAVGGLALALWVLHSLYNLWGRRCAKS